MQMIPKEVSGKMDFEELDVANNISLLTTQNIRIIIAKENT